MAETQTGIILTTGGTYYTGTGEVFRTFDTYEQAKEFCEKRIGESDEYEYVIYTHTEII